MDLGLGLGFRPEVIFLTSSGETFNIPLMLTYTIDLGAFEPYAMVGPDIRFVASTTGAGFKTLVVLADFGVGFDYWVTDHLSLGANWRYSLGLTELGTIGPATIKSRDMYILATIGLRL